MSVIYARTAWLRASLTELMGERGRDVTVLVVDGPERQLSANWRTWEPWTSGNPGPFLTSLIDNCPEVEAVVRTVRGVREDLKAAKGPYSRRENYKTFLDSWLKYPWLIDMKEGASYYGSVPGEEDPSHAQEWILKTAPAPLAKVGELVTMGKEIMLDDETEALQWDAVGLDMGPKKSSGRPPLKEDPRWQAAINLVRAMKAEGKGWPIIATALNEQFAVFGEFSHERARGLYRRNEE